MEYIALGVGLFLAFTIFTNWGRKRTLDQITQTLETGQFENFDKICSGVMCFLTIKPIQKEIFKLSAYIAQDQERKVVQQVQMIQNMRVAPNHKLLAAMNGFYYFLGCKNAEGCEICMDAVKKMNDTVNYNNMNIQYSIIVKKEAHYIDTVKHKLELMEQRNDLNNRDMMMGTLQYLLGLQYSYQNDRVNMMKYFTPALKNCEGTPYVTHMMEIMEHTK